MTAPPPRKFCSLFVNEDAFVIFCLHQEKSWIEKDGHPFVKITRDADADLLGNFIVLVLERSCQGLEITEAQSLQSPEFKAQMKFAGFPNWSRFHYANKLVHISYDFKQVQFIPTRRETNHYSHMSPCFECEYSARAIGESAIKALSLSE